MEQTARKSKIAIFFDRVKQRPSPKLIAGSVFFWVAVGAWAHFDRTLTHGYQSSQLTAIAAPVVEVMNKLDIEHLSCSETRTWVIRIAGKDFNEVLSPTDPLLGVPCPTKQTLDLDKGEPARLLPRFGLDVLVISELEESFKSESVTERRQQFASLAAVLPSVVREIEARRREQETQMAKKAADARAARATWGDK